MLTITDRAAEAITTLAAEADLPEGGGVRISSFDGEQGVDISLVGEPHPEDVVVAWEGLTLYLEPGAAEVLQDKELDVRRVSGPDGEDDELRFAVGPQQRPA